MERFKRKGGVEGEGEQSRYIAVNSKAVGYKVNSSYVVINMNSRVERLKRDLIGKYSRVSRVGGGREYQSGRQ